jgi:hypothetical protein
VARLARFVEIIFYNLEMDDLSHEYRPELIPRRGEWVAWLLFVMVAAPWLLLLLAKMHVPFIVPLFGVLLLLAAMSISLGNGMDRHTRLRIDNDGLAYHNGLRNVHFRWVQIKEVRIYPSAWNKKVRVIGENGYFDYYTLGEVKYQGNLKGRTGFVNGEEILRQIVLNCGLEIIEQLGDGVYYARR